MRRLLLFFQNLKKVSLSFSMSIKTGLFLSDFLLYHYSNFWYFKLLLFNGKLKKKLGENKNKLRNMNPNIHGRF